MKQYRQVWLWLLLWMVFVPGVQAEGIITTVAGSGTVGDGGVPAINAQLSAPNGITLDNGG